MPVYLVRHAHAGSRSAWRGDDSDRPLSPRGQRQAARIAREIRDPTIDYLGSSPAVRCVETLAPLVARLDLDLHIRPELAEGADAQRAYDVLLDLVPRNPVLCAHGDVIPALVDRMIAQGMTTSHAAVSQKGSMWIITFDGDRPREGTYLTPA